MPGKFEWDKASAPKPIKQSDLICKDCFHRSPQRTDICAVYQQVKPLEVLSGGDCAFYYKDEI